MKREGEGKRKVPSACRVIVILRLIGRPIGRNKGKGKQEEYNRLHHGDS